MQTKSQNANFCVCVSKLEGNPLHFNSLGSFVAHCRIRKILMSKYEQCENIGTHCIGLFIYHIGILLPQQGDNVALYKGCLILSLQQPWGHFELQNILSWGPTRCDIKCMLAFPSHFFSSPREPFFPFRCKMFRSGTVSQMTLQLQIGGWLSGKLIFNH